MAPGGRQPIGAAVPISHLPPMPDEHFWRERYRSGHTPWDLGGTSSAVRMLVRNWFPRTGRVFVPGCGRGHEALYLAARGYDVTALDIAPEALAWLRREAAARGVAVAVHEGDLFALGAEWDGAFDVWLEQTCLCALPPHRQADYAALAHRLLRPGGQVAAVLMEVPWDDGPPYSMPPDLVFSLFPAERWEREGPVPVEPPHPSRPGPEYLARFVRKA